MERIENIQRVRVLGVPVDSVDMPGVLKRIDSLIKNGKRGSYILAINPEKVIFLQKDRFLKQMFENAALLIPDGIGVVHAVRLLYGLDVERVPGADLMHHLCRESARKGYRIFVYGASEEVNRESVRTLRQLYPGIHLVGRCNGYMTEESMNDLIEEINKSNADVLFIALGSPRQEQWIQKYLPRLKVKVCQGVGGTLDTISGKKRRAPVFVRRLGLEWLYRLVCEPRRIRRQIVYPLFTIKVLLEKFKSLI